MFSCLVAPDPPMLSRFRGEEAPPDLPLLSGLPDGEVPLDLPFHQFSHV